MQERMYSREGDQLFAGRERGEREDREGGRSAATHGIICEGMSIVETRVTG